MKGTVFCSFPFVKKHANAGKKDLMCYEDSVKTKQPKCWIWMSDAYLVFSFILGNPTVLKRIWDKQNSSFTGVMLSKDLLQRVYNKVC